MISRRGLLGGGGALVVAFSLPIALRAQTGTPREKLPRYASIDAWLSVGQDGGVTVFCGKVELGTGVGTALAQIVAEELDVPVARLTMVLGDTGRTPDQGLTVGSKTIHHGGPQLRRATASARHALLELAAARLGVPADRLVVRDGVISEASGPTAVTYGELIGGQRFNRDVRQDVTVKTPDQYRIVGTSLRRVDIPAKVTGVHVYMHNVRVPGMLHGRVVRPPTVDGAVAAVDEASIRKIPGARVVRKGSFVGVVAAREELAIRAARELRVTWKAGAGLPEVTDLYEAIRATPTIDRVVVRKGDVDATLAASVKVLQASYRTPFQMHASIGPSCAVADVKNDQAIIWSGTQGAWGLRGALAQLLEMPPERIRVIWVEASGCYGHNGADDAAADAALLSQAVGRPVRVQWMRHDEHGWEPKGPAMVMDVRAGLSAAGAIVAWDYTVQTPTHSTRPGGEAGNLLAGQLVGLRGKAGSRAATATPTIPTSLPTTG